MNCYTLSIYRINAQKIIFTDGTFETATKHIASSELGPLESLLRKEQLRFAFRVPAARLLHSGKLTAVQRRCFYCIFHQG